MKSALFKNAFKALIIVLLVRPFVWFFLGINRYSRFKLPKEGALILAPNHNSHLDTVLIYALMPLPVALRATFAAAGDYFYEIPVVSWFLFDVCDMIPIWRKCMTPSQERKSARVPAEAQDPLQAMGSALCSGKALILFPEGTRGLPEERSGLKRGVARLAERFPDLPIYPLYMRGLGKSLPRGETIFIPLIPQVILGAPITGQGKTQEEFMKELARAYEELENRVSKKDWVAA